MSTQDGNTAARKVFSYGTVVRVSIALGAATLLAACSSGTAEESGASGDTSSITVSVHAKDHPELGKVLVDASGKTLYVADQESADNLRCVGDCLGFWFPATTSDGAAPSVPGVSLDVVRRTDNGKDQITLGGKPLYTFQLDKVSGDANGNNVEDDFGNTHFVWHAATVGDEGAPTPTPSGDTGDSGGYGGGGY